MPAVTPGEITLASRVRVSDDVLFQELDDEAVLLSLKSSVYFGLDPVGTRVWRLLAEHELLADIVPIIVAEYEVGEEQFASDLLALMADMQQQALVVVG